MVEKVKIISEEAMGEIKKEGADESIAHEVYKLFLLQLEHLSYEQLNQQVAGLKIKEVAGTLDESDLGLFKKLKSMLEMRTKAIEHNVAEVFTLAREAKQDRRILWRKNW
jgi:hypothetical protein